MSQGLKVRRSFEAGGRGRASRWQLPQANARKLRRNVWEFRRYWRYRRFFYVTQACTFNTLWSPEFLPGRYLYYHRHKNLFKANSKQNKNSGTRHEFIHTFLIKVMHATNNKGTLKYGAHPCSFSYWSWQNSNSRLLLNNDLKHE